MALKLFLGGIVGSNGDFACPIEVICRKNAMTGAGWTIAETTLTSYALPSKRGIPSRSGSANAARDLIEMKLHRRSGLFPHVYDRW